MIENTVLVKLIGKGKRVIFLIHQQIPLVPLLILNIMIVWVRPFPLLSDLPPPGPEWSQGWRWQRLGRRHRHPKWSVQLPLGLFEGGMAPPLVEEVRYGHYSFLLAFPNQGSFYKSVLTNTQSWLLQRENMEKQENNIVPPKRRVLGFPTAGQIEHKGQTEQNRVRGQTWWRFDVIAWWCLTSPPSQNDRTLCSFGGAGPQRTHAGDLQIWRCVAGWHLALTCHLLGPGIEIEKSGHMGQYSSGFQLLFFTVLRRQRPAHFVYGTKLVREKGNTFKRAPTHLVEPSVCSVLLYVMVFVTANQIYGIFFTAKKSQSSVNQRL